MAKITTITNPLTGQPVQVDQLEHTAQQIDDAIVRALPGGAIDTSLAKKMEIAWESASPSSSFVAQTVSIPTGYDLVAIYTPFTGQLYWFGKGVEGPMLYSYLNEGDSTPMMITRKAKFVDGSVTFSDAKRNVGGSVTTENTFMIPTKIYGIKL